MRVGYFGGSFDPPHRGHLAVAVAARDRFALDEVWIAPTGLQPLKPEGASASFDDRLRMTELLCAGERGLLASGIDAPLPRGLPNFTVDTLHTMQDSLPAGSRLFSIVGADAFLGLPKWKSVDVLFQLAEWVVVSRPGFPVEAIETLGLTPEQRGRVHVLEDVRDPTSATDVRARLRAGLPCEAFLPPAVLAYIGEHGLYAAAER